MTIQSSTWPTGNGRRFDRVRTRSRLACDQDAAERWTRAENLEYRCYSDFEHTHTAIVSAIWRELVFLLFIDGMNEYNSIW